MDKIISKKEIQCLYWLANGKCGECESVECENKICCCLDSDELIILEIMADIDKNWEIDNDPILYFTLIETACNDRERYLGKYVTPLVKFGADVNEVKNTIISIILPDGKLNLLRAIPVIQGINSTFYIDKRAAVVRVCLQWKIGDELFHKILVKVLEKAFWDWSMKKTLFEVKEFIDILIGDLQETILNTSDKEKLEGSIAGAYSRIENGLKIGIPLREKYNILWAEFGKHEYEGGVIEYFREMFVKYPFMEIILFMIRMLLCLEDKEYNSLDPYVSECIKKEDIEELPPFLYYFEDIIHNIHLIKNEEIRNTIVDEFLKWLRSKQYLLDENKVKELAIRVRDCLAVQ